MKNVAAVLCFTLLGFTLLGITGLSAQQPAPATTMPPPAAAQAPAVKGNFTECRKMARQNKVAKEQRQTFMRDCMKDILAECRTKAGQQKFTADERRAFLRDCTGRPARSKS